MSSTTTTAAAAIRRPKWQPNPPPPSPKILNLPRRTRRKQPKKGSKKSSTLARKSLCYDPLALHKQYYKGKLESLFDQERDFARNVPVVLLNTSETERRERVEEGKSEIAVGFVEEKWRFQAEMLRAECNFLRMEKEFALKKLEKNRVKMEKTLRSAVQTLISGRNKLFEGKNVNAVLEEEIEDLAEKLEELQRSSAIKDFEVRKCRNFDKQACHLQRRLEKLGGLSDDKYVKELQELAGSSLPISKRHEIDKEGCDSVCRTRNFPPDNVQVELLSKKMEGMSRDVLDRMEEEYGAMLSTTANSSAASSASTSKRLECKETSSLSVRQTNQESMPHEENKCSGRCKAIVSRIVEQVRAETEQWSQMQEMLGQVRQEMEQLKASRDYWESRALDSAHEVQSLQSAVLEWKEKAFKFETKADELQGEVSALKNELGKLKKEQKREDERNTVPTQDSTLPSLGKQIEKEKRATSCRLKQHHNDNETCRQDTANMKLNAQKNMEKLETTDHPPISLGKQLEKEKRMFLHRLKENQYSNAKDNTKKEISADERRKTHTHNSGLVVPKRPPFLDIGNSSASTRQNNKAVFPLP